MTCECGCGGQPSPGKRFIHGHHFRLPRPNRRKQTRWIQEDRGYKTPCWIWKLAIQSQSGYGLSGVAGTGRRAFLAHRVVYEQLRGQIPAGAQLDHLCRVRACVNPDHLEPVTQAQNCQRGRQAKLTPEQVAEIRAATGTQRALAQQYGVSKTAIGYIRAGKTWR